MQAHIRNFSIIAHIDHGKSTLADRLIELCGAYNHRKFEEQILDSMELERERGITIKAQTVMLSYEYEGQQYCFNLIDTPGHVDFSYEVSRSLAACEAALLVVDATQGVEAQTVANCYTAIDAAVDIIPVINKIDLPASDPTRVQSEIEDMIGVDAQSAILCSAKTGVGVEEILRRLITEASPPSGVESAPLRALIVDSWFDNYVGVVMLVRVVDGRMAVGDTIRLMSSARALRITNLGVFTPTDLPQSSLNTGMVGYVVTGLRELSAARVGDTVTMDADPALEPLPGFKEIQPQVFAGLYPVENHQYDTLREALDKLKLNDASLQYELELSDALGHGFRCGFLGLLHMDIVQQRLEREFDLDLVVTAPSVVYQVCLRDGTERFVENPARLPDPAQITDIREPIIACSLYLPNDYVGTVMILCAQKRGIQKDMHYHGTQVMMKYEMPLNEVVMDFFDKLKSVSRGYASFDYAFQEYRSSPLVRLDVLINGQRVDPLSVIVHKDNAQQRGRVLVQKLRGLIPRQMFDIAIQAAIGSHVIARETVKAMRKNVIAKCYGGDITRKRKLLEKQKAGKKRMKQVGAVDIPQAAFLSVLSCDD